MPSPTRPDFSQAIRRPEPRDRFPIGRAIAALLVFGAGGRSVRASEPRVLDARWSLERIAGEPEIVTPIGIAFDHRGRVLVVECHTHFPPEAYAGPKSDRIRIAEDTDNDGKLDRWTTFFEGTRATMSLRRGPEPWIYVATRMEVFRICDRDGDDRAETVEPIAKLETPGDYPHNGLCGLAFDPRGGLYFGLGENLGAPYRLVGSDGTALTGGGEGGNIYRCEADGSRLARIATGLWNPFGICVDREGRVFTVENDPDSSPPCRLLHIVPGGDYGYQFRYGRSGKHPLQAWNGELPGTLPMVAGTGEAPCAVLPHAGHLLVTSWGDHRIERFALRPQGASFRSSSEILVRGDENFRPVDAVIAANGDVLFTDWVDQSYPVHGHGRIWRLTCRDSAGDADRWPSLTERERIARELRTTPRLDAIDDADPFMRQAAVWGCATRGTLPASWSAARGPGERRAMLEAARWNLLHGIKPPEDWLRAALTDDDSEVRFLAVRVIADSGWSGASDGLRELMNDRAASPALFQAALAAIEWTERKSVSGGGDPNRDAYLLRALRSPDTSDAVRSAVLRVIPPDADSLTADELVALASRGDDSVRREAVRALATRRNADRLEVLRRIAADRSWPESLRADAIAGMDRSRQAESLRQLAAQGDSMVTRAARSAARDRTADASTASSETLDALRAKIDRSGDADAGWRLFFGSHATRCANCHRYEGRGSDIGPDLTGIAAKSDWPKLLESLVDPSREVAPHFVPWVLTLEDGRVLTGLSHGPSPDGLRETFVDGQGTMFELATGDIASRRAATASIMPSGLAAAYSVDELRDLLALLAR